MIAGISSQFMDCSKIVEARSEEEYDPDAGLENIRPEFLRDAN